MTSLVRWITRLSLAAMTLGCSEASGPSLLEVRDLSPRSLESGDVVELHGAGFPEGKAATVTLDGTLYRAGLPPVAGYRVTFDAQGESNHQVSFVVGAEVEDALREGDEHSRHATFRGRASVAFAPRIAGAPPISGELPELSLELFSATGSAERAREVSEAQRLTQLLGVSVEPTDRAVRIASIVAGRAQRAGLTTGDTIVSANGVSVFDETDLLPARQERELQLVVKRSDTISPWPVRVSIDGFSPLLPGAYTWVFASVTAIAVWLTLMFSTVRSNGLLSTWAIAALPTNSKSDKSLALATLIGVMWALLNLAQLPGSGPRFVIALPLALILLLRPLVGFFAAGGRRRAFPLRHATACALKIQGLELCTVLGLWPLAVPAGGLGALELGAAQGTLPWQWLAFRSVPTMLAAVLFLLSTLYDASGSAEATLVTPRAGATGRMLLRCDHALVFLKCALFVSLFLGAGSHSLRTINPLTQNLLSLGIFGLKYALVVAVVTTARSRLGHPARATLTHPFYSVFSLVVLASLVPVLSIRWDQIALGDWLRQGIPAALCLAAVVGGLLMLWSRSTLPSRGTAINPWL